jgi:hypothetical protein
MKIARGMNKEVRHISPANSGLSAAEQELIEVLTTDHHAVEKA